MAAEIGMSGFQSTFVTQEKADGSPVTEIDLAIEQALLRILAEERPFDTVLGEEFGTTGTAPRRWILDPIDGTFNFVDGNDCWGTHVALEQDGEIVLGIISRPARDQCWWAVRGAGAYKAPLTDFRQKEQLQVSSIATLAQSQASVWGQIPAAPLARINNETQRKQPELDDILRLAEGKLEIVIDPLGKVWDHAPAMILVEEAGGRFYDQAWGRRFDSGEGRFTNGRIDQQLKQLFKET